MRIALALVSLTLSIPGHLSSQLVTGQILDPDRSPISAAEITFRTAGDVVALAVVSNQDGRFQADVDEAGSYWVFVSRLGYEATQIGPLALSEGDSLEVELFMAVDAIPLEPITVTASRRPIWEHLEPPAHWEFWERKDQFERLGSGSFFTYDDIKPLLGMPVALAITDLAPFLFPIDHPHRRTSYLITGRSRNLSAKCFPALFLDGKLLRGPPMGGGHYEPAVLDDWIHLSQIAAVEVYRGASDTPGEFRGFGSECGAVALWSARGVRR